MKLKDKKPEAEVPTSSMADIAFLLIIFFMVTTVFSSTRGMDFKLPKEDDDRPLEKIESVYIRVFGPGNVEVDGKSMDLDQIIPYLAPKLQNWPDKPVILHTEPDAAYQDMIDVYDVLKNGHKAGVDVKNIAIPTNREIQEYIEFFGFNPFERQGG